MRNWQYFLWIVLVAVLATGPFSAQSQTPASQQSLETFADTLIAAPSEEAQNVLLDANQDLATPKLSAIIRKKGNERRDKGGPPQEVHRIYSLALAVAERVHDQGEIGRCLYAISLAFYEESDYEQALDHARKAIAILESLADPARADVYIHVGNVLTMQGNFRNAADYYARALKLKQAQDDKTGIARALFNLGNCYLSLGNFRVALEHYKKSMEVSRAAGLEVGLGYNANSVGNLYHWQGDYDLALSYYQQSLKLKEKTTSPSEIANVLNDIGLLYHDMGKDARARVYLDRALKLKEAAGDKTGVAQTLQRYGMVLNDQKNYSEALQQYRASLNISEAVGDKFGIVQTLGRMAQVYQAQKDYAHALECASRASDLARQIEAEGELSGTLDATAMAWEALGKPNEARSALAEAISAVEELRNQVSGAEEEQARFFANTVSPYQHMVQLLLSQNQPEEALAFAEQAKARVLLDVLHSGHVSVDRAMTPEEREQERHLAGRLASLNTQLSAANSSSAPNQTRLDSLGAELKQARLAYRSFQNTLYATHPGLQVERGDMHPISLAQTASLLAGANADPKTALLEFVVTEEKTYLFVLLKGTDLPQLTTYTVPIQEKDLRERVGAFRRQLATRDPAYGQSARALYRLLLGPARSALAGKTTLVIVPDGPLWELPFQALQPAQGRHLLEESAISYAPSLTVLLQMARRHRDSRQDEYRILAFGNPAVGNPARREPAAAEVVASSQNGAPHSDAPRNHTEDLPSAGYEVTALGGLYGPQRSQVYTRARASEERFKAEAPKYEVLHLATHGVFDDRSPMYSYLALSRGGGDESDDGRLEAWEVMNLELKADLVVLSACETARGRASEGEGLMGMSWAFFVAGSPSLVASQWKVDSASTTKLMVNFHRGLRYPAHLGHSAPKARALQQAALQVMKSPEYRHPFYWAGFVLVGDGS